MPKPSGSRSWHNGFNRCVHTTHDTTARNNTEGAAAVDSCRWMRMCRVVDIGGGDADGGNINGGGIVDRRGDGGGDRSHSIGVAIGVG